MGFGQSNFSGSNFKKTEFFYVGDGDNVYRILPPFGRLAKQGRWSQHYSVHWGYKNSKGIMRPFQSTQVTNKDKMIEVPDAALDRLNTMLAQLEAAKESGDKALEDRLQKLVGWNGGLYSIDKSHHINVITLDGKVGVLKLKHKAKLALDAEIKLLTAKGIDPSSLDNGRFFVFRKSGKGRDTTIQVSLHQEVLDIPGVGKVQKEFVSKLDADQIARIESEIVELDALFPKITADQVARIVKEGATAIDEILPLSGRNNAVTATPTPQEAPVAAAPAPVPAAAAPVVLETLAVLAAPALVAVPTTPSVSAMTDEEFLASMN